MLKIRMARGGAKKRPYYRIVVADSRAPRDGAFLEKLGTYNPILAKDDANRVILNVERIKFWIGQGAQTSERINTFLAKAGVVEATKHTVKPKKSAPKAKAVERKKASAEKAAKKAEAAAAATAEAQA